MQNAFHSLPPIILDFETYYDDEYSLSKITTEEYIRDPRFQSIGMSIKFDGATEFYRGESWIPRLKELMAISPDSPVGSHNAMFDAGILGLRYNIHPRNIADTMSMSAACGLNRCAGRSSLSKLAEYLQKLGYKVPTKGGYVANMKGVRMEDMSAHDWVSYEDYCKLDTDICHLIYQVCLQYIPDYEMRMMSETIRMFSKPAFALNKPMLDDYAVHLEKMRVDNLVNLTAKFNFEDIEVTQSHLRSRPKFQKLLEACNVEIPMKVSPTTGKTVPALSKKDEAYMALLDHPNPTVRQLVECRLNAASTLEQTRCARFIGIASRGLMPVPLKYASAHTKRYGGCLLGDTPVICKTKQGEVVQRHLVDVLLTDLVWDGIEWCEHEGKVFSGYQEVITHDGIIGTPGHRVFTARGTITLAEAKDTDTPIEDGETPAGWVGNIEEVEDLIVPPYDPTVPVYDILNCGPRHRFWANGKIVHNSDKINLQNLRKRSGDITLRRSICAPEGHVIIASDSSQIEARMLAFAANEQYMVDIFMSRRCPYSDMAAKIYNKTYDEVYKAAKVDYTKEGITHRNVGKETVLGCGYGMGVERFAKEMNLKGLTDAAEMAETIIATYRGANPNIKAFWATCQDALEVMLHGGAMWFGGPNNDLFYATGNTEFWGKVIPAIKLPDGGYIYYENLRKEETDESWTGWEYKYDQFKDYRHEPTRVYGGKVAENLIQALAFSVLKFQALRMVDRGVPVHLNIHDEWASVVPKSQARDAAIAHALSMREVPDYIPVGLLDCEVDIGLNYADTKTVDGL